MALTVAKTHLSYDVTVIQWITSCHKLCYDHRLHITFAGTCNVMTTSVTTMQLFIEINNLNL